MPTTVRSHAKINLGLYIGAPRADGFHSLVTVYQTIKIHDLIMVSARRASATEIRITSNDARVPTDSRNTVWKMLAMALETWGVHAEISVHIDKRLPVQGGLGAGSGNAVSALIGLEAELGSLGAHPGSGAGPPTGGLLSTEWAGQSGVTPSELLSIAAQVGSDVPLFLIGGAVLGLDRGQQVYPLPDLEPIWCLIATPAIGVSTPQAFRDWDALCAEQGLTPDASTDKLNKLSRAYASAFSKAGHAGSSGVLSTGKDLAGPQESALVRTGITSWIANDFERIVFLQHPSLAEIKRILAATGTPEAALHASLSGSGSALFGLYQTRGDAEAAERRLAAAGVESQVSLTLPRAEYWANLIVD